MPRRSSLVISGSKFNYFGVPLISPTLNFQLTLLFSGSFDDSITPLMVTEPPFPISTLPPLPFLVISNYSFHNRVKLSRYNDQPSRLLICLIRVIFRFNFEYTKKKKKKNSLVQFEESFSRDSNENTGSKRLTRSSKFVAASREEGARRAGDINSRWHDSFPGTLISHHRGRSARLVATRPAGESFRGKEGGEFSLRKFSRRHDNFPVAAPPGTKRREDALNIARGKIRVMPGHNFAFLPLRSLHMVWQIFLYVSLSPFVSFCGRKEGRKCRSHRLSGHGTIRRRQREDYYTRTSPREYDPLSERGRDKGYFSNNGFARERFSFGRIFSRSSSR